MPPIGAFIFTAVLALGAIFTAEKLPPGCPRVFYFLGGALAMLSLQQLALLLGIK